MPASLLPLISIIVGAAGVGTSIYEGVKSSDTNAADQADNKAALLKQQQAEANQANLTKQEAVLGAQGQAQEQTGGSLTDSGTAALTDLLAGYPGYQSGSSGAGSGTGAGTGSTTATGTAPSAATSGDVGSATSNTDPSSAVTAILAALRNGGSGVGGPGAGSSIFGGNWQSQPTQPQPWQELSNPPL